jgi:hypothetical protein
LEDDEPEPSDLETRVPGVRAVGVRRLALFALAFGSGFAVLTIEIAGARLIAPVFGLSAVPWTAVIGVILTALALGSHLGGRLADGQRVPLSALLAVAGLTAALPIVGVGVPWMARDLLGFVAGSVASAVVLFAPSVLCLGAVVPYLVQADTEALGAVGRRAGDMSAAASNDPAALPSIGWPRAALGPAGRALTDRWAPVEYLQASYFIQGVRWR